MDQDASISLDETFEEIDLPVDHRSDINVHASNQERLPIGRGEFLIKRTSLGTADYEYECPDWAYEGSPVCEGNCVWVPQSDQPSGWRLCCFGCVGTETCITPSRGFSFYRLLMELTGYEFAATPCVEEYEGFQAEFDPTILPGSVELLSSFKKIFDQPVEYGLLKLPSIYDPSKYMTVRLALGAEPLYLNFPSHGWRASVVPNLLPLFSKAYASPPVVMQHPAVTPTNIVDFTDKALSASVVLPERNGAQQFWVSIPESSCHPQSPLKYCSLVTQRWTVTLYRLPLPSVDQKGSDCRCG